MLKSDIDFFDQCVLEHTIFDKSFANSDDDWQLIKSMYDKYDQKEVENKIPNLLHFIWIGDSFPKIYLQNLKAWEKQNPDLGIILWRDETIIEFLKDKKSFDSFNKATSLGLKSDIARYEILKHFGGTYVDTDYLCTSQEFSKLNSTTSFYAGICQEKPVQVNNGVIGSCPNHPILDICIDNIDLDSHSDVSCKQTRVLYQTGPWLLTSAILSYLSYNKSSDVVIFPTQTFHPMPGHFRHEVTEDILRKYIKPWSMACHLFHASWQK